MTTIRIFAGAAAILTSMWTLVGCANNQETAGYGNTNPSAKTYESQDLSRTGKRTSGEALQAADPAVTTKGGN